MVEYPAVQYGCVTIVFFSAVRVRMVCSKLTTSPATFVFKSRG